MTFIIGLVLGFIFGMILQDYLYFAKIGCNFKTEKSCFKKYIKIIRDLFLRK